MNEEKPIIIRVSQRTITFSVDVEVRKPKNCYKDEERLAKELVQAQIDTGQPIGWSIIKQKDEIPINDPCLTTETLTPSGGNYIERLSNIIEPEDA